MATKRDFRKVVLGRSEGLEFVEYEMRDVPAKTDTGAYRSAVHAKHIFLDKDEVLHFHLLGEHPVCGHMAKEIISRNYNEVWIANSFGHREKRYEVRLKVKLGPKVFMAAFSLADRSKKIYPVLLGRKLLNGRFLVDSAETGLDRKSLKEKYTIEFPMDEEEDR
jgi:hypothetical protein